MTAVITAIGLVLAMTVFQLHCSDGAGNVITKPPTPNARKVSWIPTFVGMTSGGGEAARL